jgi:hypothetical protein
VGLTPFNRRGGPSSGAAVLVLLHPPMTL